MTIDQQHIWAEGRMYWEQYVQLNGYAFSPTKEGIRVLSQSLSLPARKLRHAITTYLEN